MKDETYKISLLTLLVLFASLSLYLYFYDDCDCEPEVIYIDTTDSTLTKQNLWYELKKYPFHCHELVMKSAIYECGHAFDSRNARERNNLFGMTCGTRADSCDAGYAVFSTWQESVADRYVHEQRHWQKGSYRRYINAHWGVMDGRYTKYLDRININLNNE